MSGCHAATVTRCDSRADFGACPCCGYSAAGEPFSACPCNCYSAIAGSPFRRRLSLPCIHTRGAADYLTDTSNFEDWLLAGDLNLIRQQENRNKPGGDFSEMQMFNDLILDLNLVEIPFSGRCYTWSNMQADPLLGKLDWVLTSTTWTLLSSNFSTTPAKAYIRSYSLCN